MWDVASGCRAPPGEKGLTVPKTYPTFIVPHDASGGVYGTNNSIHQGSFEMADTVRAGNALWGALDQLLQAIAALARDEDELAAARTLVAQRADQLMRE